MLQLRQFDLQLAFVRMRTLGEDIEDQASAVDHAPLQRAFKVALLHRRERMVDQYQVGTDRIGRCLHFRKLAAADQGGRVGAVDARGRQMQHLRAGGARQLGELLHHFVFGHAAAMRLDQQRVLASPGTVEQLHLLHPFFINDALAETGFLHQASICGEDNASSS